MLSLIKTLLDGASARAEDNLKDRFAIDLLAQRIRDGQAPKVKVYDKTAPSRRPVVVPTPEMQRTRDRAAPAPVR